MREFLTEHSIGQEMQLSFRDDKIQELKSHYKPRWWPFLPSGALYVSAAFSFFIASFLNYFGRLWLLPST